MGSRVAERAQRSELNYLIAGVILLLGGGYTVNLGQDEDLIAGVIVGAMLIVLGLGLIGQGVLRGSR